MLNPRRAPTPNMLRSAGLTLVKSRYAPRLPWFLSSLLLLLCADAAGAIAAKHTARAIRIAKRFMCYSSPVISLRSSNPYQERHSFGERKSVSTVDLIWFDAHSSCEVGCSLLP